MLIQHMEVHFCMFTFRTLASQATQLATSGSLNMKQVAIGILVTLEVLFTHLDIQGFMMLV
ncbi:hypothetical protein A9239_05930 [Methanosarcina sp. A14]|nr:hypothetical protein A9239_05930 [Methanosarcina sp. A14]